MNTDQTVQEPDNSVKEVRIFGYSDDLIEVEGAIKAEFALGSNEPEEIPIVFSDGTVITVNYTSAGIWRFTRIVAGTSSYSHVAGSGRAKDYSDVVTLKGDLRWVVCGRDSLVWDTDNRPMPWAKEG